MSRERTNRVLVVDGNADLRTLLAQLLRLEGLEVEVACDKDEALAKSREHCPNLAVLACHLWRDDAQATLDELKSHFPTMRFIVFCEGEVDLKRYAHETECVSKFAPVPELLEKVRKLSGLHA